MLLLNVNAPQGRTVVPPSAAAARGVTRRTAHVSHRQSVGGGPAAYTGALRGLCFVGRHGVGVKSVATESIAGYPVVLGSYDEEVFEPSNDLRELAAAQLQSLFAVLKRISPSSSGSCKACVYARRADSLDGPQMKLQRVACCKSTQAARSASAAAAAAAFGFCSSSSGSGPSSSDNSFEELDEFLTLHRAAWEPGSGSSGCETEALLINEEIVLLPSSNLLVLPLAEAGTLVGLLVVEVHSKHTGPVPYQPQPLQQQPKQQQEQPAWELPPVLGLSEDVLWALRMSVPPLAKACAMDLRTALAGAQQEARQRLARSLLLEARGPLKVLGTFGTMLAPRLRTGQSGEPESDMADGMLLQGQRLADVVAQLEGALRPQPRASAVLGFSSSDGGGSSSSGGGWSSAQQQQQQQPWHEPLALPAAASDDGNMSDDDDSWAVADSPEQQLQQQQPQRQPGVQAAPGGSGGGASPVAAHAVPLQMQQSLQRPKGASNELPELGAAAAQPQPSQQQQVVVVDLVLQQRTADSLGSSSRDIRWSGVQAPVSPTVLQPAAKGSSSPVVSTDTSSSSRTGVAYAPVSSGSFDAAKTIDLELQPADSSSSGVAAVTAVPAWPISSSGSLGLNSTVSGVQQQQQQQLPGAAASSQLDHQQQQQAAKPPARQAVCNVVEVLSQLLSAAAGLAQAQGINLIVNHPLHLDAPGGSGQHGSSGGSRGQSSSTIAAAAAGASSSSIGASSTALVLLPRPALPLMAGVAGAVCRRVLGYVVDVALQCTPRGGQVCVTARASSGGVEVSVMHTGHAQPSRLHTSSAAIDAAALGAAGPAPAVAAAAAAGPVEALLRNKRRRQEAAAAATTSRGSSSSTWSKGLQELAASSGLRGGSSLITLDFARQVLQSIGGRLKLTYPHHFMNAMSGQLEVGSNIEVWLPSPAPTT